MFLFPLLAVPFTALALHLPHHHRNHHKHHKHSEITQFDLCVANREAGEPGATSYNTINWRYSGAFEGAYNWVNSTWLAMGGGRYARHAYDATPLEQTQIFNEHANSQDWPQTVPACWRYR